MTSYRKTNEKITSLIIAMVSYYRENSKNIKRMIFISRIGGIFIILNGMAMIRIDKEEAVLEREDVVVVPVGKVHEMKNIGDEDVQYIVVWVSQEKGGKTVVVVS